MGPVALHGGGEFLPGDEAFIDELLAVAAAGPASSGTDSPICVVIIPTAAARGRPDLAAENGIAAFGRRASATGREVDAQVARIVDAASAADPSCAALVASADVVHFPGGDPDLIPALFETSAAGRALAEARERGAVIAGASAGAMALAEWSWTPKGGVQGLGFVEGVAVVPHYDDIRRLSWQAKLDEVAPDGLGYLGLDERTGVISDNGSWLVVGEGAAHWFPRGSSTPVIARHGERISRSG
jgi:cyanophycinase